MGILHGMLIISEQNCQNITSGQNDIPNEVLP